MMKSVWSDSVQMPSFGKLSGDAETDVLIIGGGMCGVLCAHFLQQLGVNYILVEANQIGGGITKNTTAKITSQHGLIYHKLIKNEGMESAKLHLQCNEWALENFKELCQDKDCDFERKSAYTYSIHSRKRLSDEVTAVNSLGFHADLVLSLPLSFETSGAIEVKNQAQFNPLKFLAHISTGLNIFDNTRIIKMGAHTAVTDSGKITARKIIVASHFPFINNHGSYFIKMYQHRSYVIALENAPNLNGIYVDEVQNGMSFRNYKDLLFIGGGDHRTGKKGGNWDELRSFAKKYYPNSRERYHWATQDCMSLDSVPYIGNYSKHTPDLYVASGFNKWGMTRSMVAAKVLSDMVIGQENEYSQLFSPDRCMLHPRLFVNAFNASISLVTPTTKRCPHLGCALKWNALEHSWDCPCHGSRFEENGKLIDNPANGSIK